MKDDFNNIMKEFNGTTGYPKGSSYTSSDSKTLTPSDHFYTATADGYDANTTKYLIDDEAKHFIRDTNDVTNPDAAVYPVTYTDQGGVKVPIFSGSTTNVNPFNDSDMNKIITEGLENSEIDRANTSGKTVNATPKISPLIPFTRLDPKYAQQSNLITYNRTKLPISDLEYRKGFRHIFITRPECYVMASDSGKPILSQQAEYDEDFASAYSIAPHLLALLSPSYVTGSFSNDGLSHNWNFLLSNRVASMSNTPSMSMSFDEAMTKSSEGYTISPAKHMQSRQGSTLSLTFNDTKTLEVNRFMELWMAYMHKRKKGIFAPPYNGYKYKNEFMKISGASANVSGVNNHPYDRALEYCATIFDIYTNESDTKILYWCKYYGVYPTEVNVQGLSPEKNGAITTQPTVDTTFKYHRKIEYSNKSLIEFNYNAGLTDDVGNIKPPELTAAYPFLLNESKTSPYIGASSMFVGSPYIIMGSSGKDPWKNETDIVSPYLQFMALKDGKLNWNLNTGITNSRTDDSANLVGVVNNGSTTHYSSSGVTHGGTGGTF